MAFVIQFFENGVHKYTFDNKTSSFTYGLLYFKLLLHPVSSL